MKFFVALLILRNGKILVEKKHGKYYIPMEEYREKNKILLGTALRLLERKIGIKVKSIRFLKRMKGKNRIVNVYHVEEFRLMKLKKKFCFVDLKKVNGILHSFLK
jgi:predicted NUDIX family NTP pyrophosphohydrolase